MMCDGLKSEVDRCNSGCCQCTDQVRNAGGCSGNRKQESCREWIVGTGRQDL